MAVGVVPLPFRPGRPRMADAPSRRCPCSSWRLVWIMESEGCCWGGNAESLARQVSGWSRPGRLPRLSSMNARLRALCDLMVSEVREYVGLHEYDGVVADLSPEGVKARLARLGDGPPEPDAHDEAHLAAFEARLRAEFGVAELHRRSPMALLAELDLSAYEREYAPAAERAAARRRHMAAWPDAIDAGLASLDQVSAPVARSLQAAVEGLADGLSSGPEAPDDPLVV